MEMRIMSELVQTKDEEQRKALNAWAQKSNCIGSIIAGTGFGKSRCGVLAINKMLTDNNSCGLVLVPTQQLQVQFREEFIKWDCEDILDKIDIICYQSAYKLKENTSWFISRIS